MSIKNKKRGLTLIELLAVVAIIAILFILLIPQISSAIEKAKVSGAETDLHSYDVGIKSYLFQNEGLEHTEEKINSYLDKNLQFTSGESKEKSPWNTPYKLEINGEEISVSTKNADKEPKIYKIKYKKEDGYYVDEKVGFDKEEKEENVRECMRNANATTDFEVSDVTGGVSITNYIGTSKSVVIPCEINGKDVVEIAVAGTTTPKKSFNGKDLTSVTIPNTVKKIGEYAFAKNKLTSIVIPNSVTVLEGGSFRENLLTSITLSNSLTKIEWEVFSNNKLTSFVIPSHITHIGEFAFDANLLTTMKIPSTVTGVDFGAFYNNTNLKNVQKCSSITLGTNHFNSSPTINNTGC